MYLFFSGNKQLCSREVASYSLVSTIDGYSTLQSSIQRESHTGVFCIQSQNGELFTSETSFIMWLFAVFLCEAITDSIPLACVLCRNIVQPEAPSVASLL